MDFPKVCYITSQEPFLVKEKLNEIKLAFINKFMGINFKKIKSEELKNEIEIMPFFADKKMLLLEAKDNEKEAEILKNVPDFCSVIIINELDKRKKLYKTIQEVGKIIELEPYDESQMKNWVIKVGEKMGISVPKNVAERIVEICGISDMYYIYNEMIKLASMDEEITVDLVDRVITKTPEYNSFMLTDAITKKDKERAYQIIKVLSEQGEYLPKILALINRNFAILRMLKTMSDSEVRKVDIHPYIIKLLRPYAKDYTIEQLEKLMNICQQADFEMKSGVNHQIVLEKIIGVI